MLADALAAKVSHLLESETFTHNGCHCPSLDAAPSLKLDLSDAAKFNGSLARAAHDASRSENLSEWCDNTKSALK